MSKFASPKVYAAGETPLSGVLGVGFNDIVTALAAAINNIHNEQIASGAAIKGAKFLDASVTTAKLADKAVSSAKLASTNLMALGEQSDISGGTVTLTSGSVTLVDSLSRAITGGPVLILAALSTDVTVADNGQTVQVWLTRATSSTPPYTGDAVILRTHNWVPNRASESDILFWYFTEVDMPAADTYYWEVYAQRVGDSAAAVKYHHLWVIELR